MTYDLAIIGGGIAGLGLFARAAGAGLSTVLLERGRRAGATTSATSGLFHGGLRYLPYDVATSYSMCREISALLNENPKLLRRQAFLWPIYRGQRYGLGLVDSLQDYYDLFQPWRQSRTHVRLCAKDAVRIEPGLAPNGLLGALAFDEWGVDVEGLVESLASAARAAGGVLREHCRVAGFHAHGGRIEAAATQAGEVAARVFVNAAGPWAEEVSRLAGGHGVKLSLRKGVHLVVDGPAPRSGFIFPGSDGRYIGLYPRTEGFLVGPTDDPHRGAPDEAAVLPEEERALREALNRLLPSLADRPSRTIVGLRPIFQQRGFAPLLSRDFRIYDHAVEGTRNLLTITGGKLTSHRAMADAALALVLDKLGRAPQETPGDTDRFPWSILDTRRRSVSLAASAALLVYYAARRGLGAGGGKDGLAAFKENYGWPE